MTDEKHPDIEDFLDAVNAASAQGRNNWLGFLVVVGYMLVAIASVTHEDLLFNNPVKLPIFNVDIPLVSFFQFAPLLLLLLHLGLLVQHVLLVRKLHALKGALSEHPNPINIQLRLHSYAFTEAITGPKRSVVLGFALWLMQWVTLNGLPVLTLLYFQIGFLPYHDVGVTWWHRILVISELAVLTGVGIFMTVPETSWFRVIAWNFRYKTLRSLGSVLGLWSVLIFSWRVATVPGEPSDILMADTVIGDSPRPRSQRKAFWLTKKLFEGSVNQVSGKPNTLLGWSRNLVLPDANLVALKDLEDGEISRSLRDRDLNYAVFDRADLRRVDFTGSRLNGASLRSAKLEGAKFGCAETGDGERQCAELQGADLRWVKLQGADLIRAELQGANLRWAELQGADLIGAELQGADLRWVQVWLTKPPRKESFIHADLRGLDVKQPDRTALKKIVDQIENVKVRQQVEKRLASLLKTPPDADAGQTAEFQTWGPLIGVPRSAPSEISTFLAKRACKDRSEKAYEANALARRVAQQRYDDGTGFNSAAGIFLDAIKECDTDKKIPSGLMADLKEAAEVYKKRQARLADQIEAISGVRPKLTTSP